MPDHNHNPVRIIKTEKFEGNTNSLDGLIDSELLQKRSSHLEEIKKVAIAFSQWLIDEGQSRSYGTLYPSEKLFDTFIKQYKG